MNRSLKSFACRIAYSPLGNKIANGLGITGMWARLQVRSKQKRLWAEAKKQFAEGTASGTLEDYRDALRKHWVSYAEYAFQYAFYKKTESERRPALQFLQSSTAESQPFAVHTWALFSRPSTLFRF